MVTTGGRGCRLASSSPEACDDHVLDVGLGDAHHLVAELLDDQRRGVGVDGLVLRRHDAVLHQRLDHGGDALGHAVGQLLHGDGVGHAAPRAPPSRARRCGSARRRFSRSWRRFIAAIERWRPSSSVALAMVSLPERRRSSSPLARLRLLLDAGDLRSAIFFGPIGRPASARAAWACAAAGSSTSASAAARRGRRLGLGRGLGVVLGLLGGGGGGALLLDLALLLGALGGLLLGAQPRSARPRAPRWPRAPCSRRSASCALAASTAFSRRSNSASRQVLGGADAARVAGAVAWARRAWGRRSRLRLCSTVTDLVRPWLKLWRTWLVSVPPAAQPERLALAGPVLVIRHSVLAFPAGAFPRHPIPAPPPRTPVPSVHVPDA